MSEPGQTMKALHYTTDHELVVDAAPVPAPRDGEVLIRVAAAGICGSDIHGVASRSPRRQPPLIMGHELVGTVVSASGLDGESLVGRRVAVNPQVPCGRCRHCRSGHENVCGNRQLIGGTRPGGFAEYVSVPARCAHPFSRASPATAVLAEPLATCVHALGLLSTRLPDSAVVIGAGTIGILAAHLLRAAGAGTLVLCDSDPGRRENAAATADVVVAPDALAEAVADVTAGRGADVTVDAVGVEASRRSSLEILKVAGETVWLGMHSDEARIGAFAVVVREQRVQGSFAYTDPEFATAVRMLEDAAIEPAVPCRAVALNGSAAVFNQLLDGPPQDYLKAIIRPDGDVTPAPA